MQQEAMDNRSRSCRGVSFEIHPHKDPFAIDEPRPSRRVWLPWGSSKRIAPTTDANISRSTSRASSHFCDMETDDEEDDNMLINIEEGYVRTKSVFTNFVLFDLICHTLCLRTC